MALIAVALTCLVLIPFTSSPWLDVTLTLAAITATVAIILVHATNVLPFLMIMAAAPIIPFVKWFEPAFEKQAIESEIQALNSELDVVEGSINQFFLNNASALESIEVLIGHEQEIDDALYQRWLLQILPAARNQFLNVALSKDLIIEHVYPTTDTNLRVIGVDQANIPNQGMLYKYAASTRQPLIIGPVMLLQGVPGIIYVRPVKGTDNLILAGVLSLDFLRTDLELLLPAYVQLGVDISTLAVSYPLMETPETNALNQLERSLKFGEIDVSLKVSSTQVDDIIERTQTITRTSAVAFWLAISLILSLQHLNYRMREAQRQALKKSESKFVAAQRLGQMGSWSSDDNATMILSEPLQELILTTSETMTLDDFFSRLHPATREQESKQIRQFLNSDKKNLTIEHQLKANDDYRWFEHRIAKSKEKGCTGILRDVHALRKRDEQVALLESFDSLTGAANRHYFKQLTIQNLAVCERRRTTLALVLVNIDDFRAINEKHGHVMGDELLKQVTYRLQSSSRKSDTIARLSGDTFAIALVDIGKNKQSVLVIEQILRRLKEPYVLTEDIYPQFTLGASMYPDDGYNYDTLLRMAESALSSAKSHARGHYRFYSAELSEQTDRRQKVLAAIPAAIRNNHLSLVFQPRVNSHLTTNTTSMEALVRWNDPELGFVSPGEFIPIAEQSSLIADIGQWVMEHVFATVAQYGHAIPEQLSISINLSPRQLEDSGLVTVVKDLVQKYKVKACQFELEITEYSISEESEAVLNNMRELNAMGFRFALDDFGTGYSNLGILQSLPLHVLKVDMSFIRAIGASDKSDELVKAIVSIGHTLGLSVVAEGVESAAQVSFLRELNCDELQGFYFFKPTAIEDLLPYLSIELPNTTEP